MKKGLLTIFFSVVALVSFGQGAIQTFNSEVIGRFTFANINNPSPSGVTTTPCTGYSDFSIGNNSISDGNLTNAEYIAGVTPGGTYTFEIKGDDCISGWGSIPSSPSIKRAAKVWIDMNNDGDLMDAGDLVYATPLLSYSTLTAPTFYGTVTMPLSLSPGDTLDMRVMYCRIQTLPSMWTFPYMTSTSAYYHGETEDYSIIVEGFIDTVETTDLSCYGADDGAITITPMSSAPSGTQYSINGLAGPWSSTLTYTGLASGTYDVWARDLSSGIYEQYPHTVVVAEPLPLLASAFVSDSISCNGSSDGEITYNAAGGTAPYAFSIDTVNYVYGYSSPYTNTALSSGTYYVSIQDTNGCTVIDTVVLTDPPALSASVSLDSAVSCFGASDGEVTITVSGGTGSIYDVDFGTTPFSGTSPIVASSLSAGNYNITVTDENGCQTVIATSLANPAPLSVTTTQIDAGCDGATDGVAWAIPSGGTPGYTYVWSDGQTDSAAINLEFGNYVVTVTDTNACSATTWVTISEPYITTSAENVLCYGSTVGIISAQVLNGNNSYTYLWSNGQTTATATGLGAGIYTVSATDPFGCVLTATDSISQPEELVVNILHTPICEIGEVSEIEAEVDGGVLPYDFTWNTTEITPVIYHPGGAYSVNVVDANGCLAFKSASVLGYSPLMISTYTQDASCFDNDDGLALVNVVGGLSPYTYQWSNGVTDSLNNQLTSGDHYLEVSDAQGCSESFVVTIFADESTCLNPYSAFTPNGDQNNDYWVIDNIELYPDALVEVFNRWGDRVYASKRYTNSWSGGWKGEYNGEVLPSATYYYVITLNNHEEPYKGTITIVR